MAAAPRSLVETFEILCVSYENFKNSSKQNLEDNYKSFVRQYKEFYESIEKALPEDVRAVLQTIILRILKAIFISRSKVLKMIYYQNGCFSIIRDWKIVITDIFQA